MVYDIVLTTLNGGFWSKPRLMTEGPKGDYGNLWILMVFGRNGITVIYIYMGITCSWGWG